MRESLSLLGATVDPANDGQSEDAFITPPSGTRGAVEVKGKGGKKLIVSDDLRQVMDWTNQGELAEPDARWKPIIVANVQRTEDPASRAARPYDGAPLETFIDRHSICVLPTRLIFQQICKLQDGTHDAEQFWKTIEEAHGVPSLGE